MFEVGQILTNDFEVSRNAVTIEIKATWIDDDDAEVYYVVKCIDVARDHEHNMFSSWYYDDEVDLVSEAHLDKYYNIVERSQTGESSC